jgi:RHS repeat-associated protein
VLSQPRRGAQRPVLGVVPRVRRVASYEGQGGDPRVTEELVLAYDSWGAPTRTAQVAYARRGAVDDAAQARTWVTVTDSGRADVDVDGQFLLGAELEASQLELVGVAPVGGRLGVEALTAPAVVAALAAPASFEQALDPAATAPAARRLSWQRTYYWDAARATPAAFGVVPKAPRVHHAEVACLTPGLVAATLAPRIDAAGVAALGYVLADGHWWQRGPVQEVGGPFGLVTRTVRGDGATAEQVYDSDQLVVTAQIDALGLSTSAIIDYRVMAPARTIDPNGTTRSAVHDGFGRVVASGVEGHVGAQPWKSGTAIGWAAGAATVASVLADPAGYLADAATATFIDDRAWARDATPIAEVMVARSALVDDGAGGGAASGPLEVRVRYLDGFGRVLQEKVRVEAGPAIQRDASGAVIVDAGGRPVLGPATERWQVSGHVVYDAKGQPGRMYEPYFSPSAAYEGDAVLARFGVSTLTTYDAVGRPVRVDLPNGTYATTTHGAWATTAATPGDTVLDSTYRVVREGRPVDDAERVAYEHAAGHAGTPTVTYVDARGAACATRAVGDASAADAWTRQVLDATGQAGAVIDARGLTAFTYVRDLRGRVVAQASVDAGPTWALADAYDRPVWTWDGRGFAVTRGFDVADRPTTVHVTGGDGVTAMDAVVETYLYGDQAADRAAAVAANTVGRLVEVKDGAGVVSVSAYDPLGAVRAQGRRLRATVDEAPDWRGAEALESEVLTTVARTDALGREVWTALVDGTVRASTYARGGALASVRVTTPDGALVEAPIVEGLTRDAHGRVVAATLGNGVGQTWAYDPASGRLVAQDAVRGTRAYQGLRCTYDPDGKLVRMLDVAQDGPGALVPGAVSARRDFGYDAHGRLVEATGRVHQALLPHDGPTTAGCVHGARHLSLNNGAALERYTQRFSYDAGGNLTRVQHAGTTASWATDYWVAAGSNRSTAAEDGNGVPVVNPAGMFDAGGNLRELWHLRAMGWSWRGCLTHATTVARATGPVDDGERYAYGADRVRVRKVATRLVVGGAEPVVETREVVYCGGGQERVRVARNGTLVLERWTTHVSDGDRRVAVIDRHVVDTLANEVDAIGPARVRYHLTTPQGSTAVELDEAGLLVSYEEYLPHGGSAFIAGDEVREVARRDVRYAGKERDRATGLDAYPQRYYAPWLGRWLSPDPIGPKDGLNLYAFVGGDPVGYVDPEGTERRLHYQKTDDPHHYLIVDDRGATVGDEIYDRELNRWDSVPTLQQVEHVDLLDAAPADARVIDDPRFGTIVLADNEKYDEQYGAVHAYTEVDGAQVETITSGFGGVGGGHQDGHAQFRIVRDETGPHYQVNSGINSYEEQRFGWQDVSPERFEYFRNVNYAYEQDPVGWAAAAGVSNPTKYFTRVLSEELKDREVFRARMRSVLRQIAKDAIRMIPGVAEAEMGVAVGEAMTGRESNLTVDAAVDGNFGEPGGRLSTKQRIFRGAVAVAMVAAPAGAKRVEAALERRVARDSERAWARAAGEAAADEGGRAAAAGDAVANAGADLQRTEQLAPAAAGETSASGRRASTWEAFREKARQVQDAARARYGDNGFVNMAKDPLPAVDAPDSLLVNQVPESLQAELDAAAAAGVRPVEAGGESFGALVNKGTIKWVVTKDGRLIVAPHSKGGVEISHAVLAQGAPVRAAGQADIAAAGGGFFGLEITPHSGHYMNGATAEQSAAVVEIGRDAFTRIGVIFR